MSDLPEWQLELLAKLTESGDPVVLNMPRQHGMTPFRWLTTTDVPPNTVWLYNPATIHHEPVFWTAEVEPGEQWASIELLWPVERRGVARFVEHDEGMDLPDTPPDDADLEPATPSEPDDVAAELDAIAAADADAFAEHEAFDFDPPPVEEVDTVDLGPVEVGDRHAAEMSALGASGASIDPDSGLVVTTGGTPVPPVPGYELE